MNKPRKPRNAPPAKGFPPQAEQRAKIIRLIAERLKQFDFDDLVYIARVTAALSGLYEGTDKYRQRDTAGGIRAARRNQNKARLDRASEKRVGTRSRGNSQGHVEATSRQSGESTGPEGRAARPLQTRPLYDPKSAQ